MSRSVQSQQLKERRRILGQPQKFRTRQRQVASNAVAVAHLSELPRGFQREGQDQRITGDGQNSPESQLRERITSTQPRSRLPCGHRADGQSKKCPPSRLTPSSRITMQTLATKQEPKPASRSDD